MGPVYQATCAACGHQSRRVPGRTLALLVTDADEDARRAAGEEVLVVLHPLVPFVLEEFGLSAGGAAWDGRLVDMRAVVCRDCGRISDRRRLTAGGFPVGCGWVLLAAVAAAVAGLTAFLASGNPFAAAGAGMLAGVAPVAAAELGATGIVRRRFPHRARAVDSPPWCPECGGRDLVPVDRCRGPVPCPACGQRAAAVAMVGRG